MAYENILVHNEGPVGVITLNRPQALNALNATLMNELSAALDGFEADAAIGAVVMLQASGIGAVNLAGGEPLFTPLMYAVALLPMAVGLYIIVRPSRRPFGLKSLSLRPAA